MNFKKSLLAFFLIICILFTVSGVSAGDVNDTAIASEDTIEDTISNIEQTTNDEISNDTLTAGESDEISASESDDEVLADDDLPLAKIIFDGYTGKYENDVKIYIKMVNSLTGKPIGFGHQIIVHVINTETNTDWMHGVNIDYYGNGVLNWKDTTQGAGNFLLKVYADENWHGYMISPCQAKITVSKNSVKIAANPLSAKCQSTAKFAIKVVESDKRAAANVVLNFKIHNSKKWVSYKLKTNSNGVATFNKVSELTPGKHNVVISVYGNKLTGNTVKTYINIAGKMSVVIKPYKLSTIYKLKDKFQAKIINSKTKRPMAGVPIALTIDGKKTVSLTSNAKGIVSFSTSKLGAGTHKVTLKVKANKNFAGKAAASSIKITKLAPGQKAKTAVKLTSFSLSSVTKEEVIRMEVAHYQYGDHAYPVYGYYSYAVVKFTPTLKLFNGNNLNGEYTAVLRYAKTSSGANSEYKNVFKGKFGQTKSFTGSVRLGDDLKYAQLIIQYKGNSVYGPVKYVSKWIRI